MPLTSHSFADSLVPDEIITSGDYQSALSLLEKESAPSEILAESFYRLGNRFYSAEQKNIGKTGGDEFREGKITLPVILAFRRGDEQERTFWRRTLGELEQTRGDLDRAIELMVKHDALNDTIKRAWHYGAIARDSLGIFKDCQIKYAFHDLIDFCIERAH